MVAAVVVVIQADAPIPPAIHATPDVIAIVTITNNAACCSHRISLFRYFKIVGDSRCRRICGKTECVDGTVVNDQPGKIYMISVNHLLHFRIPLYRSIVQVKQIHGLSFRGKNDSYPMSSSENMERHAAFIIAGVLPFHCSSAAANGVFA